MSRARDFADLAGSADAGGLTGKNMVINGAMQVAQRGTSSTSTGYQTVDRFELGSDSLDEFAFTVSQSTETPDGFSNSLRINATTAESSVTDSETFYVLHNIEAQNLQHLGYGTSSAKRLTLSFWVRSSSTGNYSILFFQGDASRSNTQKYTVNAADTWEHKTITIDGDTGGTINNDNGAGLSLYFSLGGGPNRTGTPHSQWGAYSQTDDFAFSDQTQFISTTGNWYITGVQLEVGEQATPFEHRSFGDELLACQRYYYQATPTYGFVMSCNNGTSAYGNPTYPVVMRAAPSITMNYTLGSFYVDGASRTISSFTPQNISNASYQLHLQGSGYSGGQAGHLDVTSYFYKADSEL